MSTFCPRDPRRPSGAKIFFAIRAARAVSCRNSYEVQFRVPTMARPLVGVAPPLGGSREQTRGHRVRSNSVAQHSASCQRPPRGADGLARFGFGGSPQFLASSFFPPALADNEASRRPVCKQPKQSPHHG